MFPAIAKQSPQLKGSCGYASAAYVEVESSGPASPPLGFHAPSVKRAKKSSVLCFDPDTESFCKKTVLMELEVDEKDNLVGPQRGFLITGKTLKTTLCGEILLSDVVELTKNHRDRDNIPGQPEGEVYKETGVQVAIKVDKRRQMQYMHDMGHPHPENPWKEVAAIQMLGQTNSHPNIVNLAGAFYDDNFLYMVMPYFAGGSLHELINSHHQESLGETQARNYFRQIISAIDYMHSQGVCHRDISTHNIMLCDQSASARCVVIDFGMCLRVPHSYLDDHHTEDTTDISAGTMRRLIHSQSHCGKLRFMAPEMYRMEDFDGLTVDLWSAAVVLFVMLSGHHPYEKPDSSDGGFHDLMNPDFYWNTSNNQLFSWGHPVSDEAVDLLHGMLALDPRKRLSLEEVTKHPWVVTPPGGAKTRPKE